MGQKTTGPALSKVKVVKHGLGLEQYHRVSRHYLAMGVGTMQDLRIRVLHPKPAQKEEDVPEMIEMWHENMIRWQQLDKASGNVSRRVPGCSVENNTGRDNQEPRGCEVLGSGRAFAQGTP